ncbi:hypothetical protein Ae201684P_010622 [Aphanomyces euteiches]|uniref:Nucleotide-diphospho-sugar transferase domain-containing protein n=1 Tax=Aphanomyces euteiches TaxID=100861 RepID=A0A6G0WP80_9STRA|nr:hypothetical protein Ae201684_013122 [Aphanomyces euteiches]KAH9076686.1 hypothetical protein Ae201684P_010622 [Aphanomyces euteiches]KAH9156390.1 hypothetical protein AeRB84_001672 [Aphanomyces euteiches]
MQRGFLVVVALLALSCALFIFNLDSSITTPMDPRETTSSYPWAWIRVNSTEVPRMAYMLYATDARTVCNAIIMAHNIRKMGTPTSIPIVTLVSWSVAHDVIQRLRDAQIEAIPVEPWTQTHANHPNEWTESLTKLRIFQERGYDKIIYLDSDAWVHRNLDHLFALGDAPLWAPHAYYFSPQYVFASTLLVFSPSNRLFHDMERAVANPTRPDPDYYDMDVLNDSFKLDCGYLPNHYVVLSYTLIEPTKWSFGSKEERFAKTYVTHFSPGAGVGKPWNTPRDAFHGQQGDYLLVKALYEAYWHAEDELCPWFQSQQVSSRQDNFTMT